MSAQGLLFETPATGELFDTRPVTVEGEPRRDVTDLAVCHACGRPTPEWTEACRKCERAGATAERMIR